MPFLGDHYGLPPHSLSFFLSLSSRLVVYVEKPETIPSFLTLITTLFPTSLYVLLPTRFFFGLFVFSRSLACFPFHFGLVSASVSLFIIIIIITVCFEFSSPLLFCRC